VTYLSLDNHASMHVLNMSHIDRSITTIINQLVRNEAVGGLRIPKVLKNMI
jgi:hypothetical protein